MDPTDDLMLSPDAADPNEFLRQILAMASSTEAAKSPAIGVPPLPRQDAAIARPPMPAPLSAAPMSAEPADDHKSNLLRVIQMILPAIGSLAAGGGHNQALFWDTFTRRQQELQQEREQKQEKERAQADTYTMEAVNKLHGTNNPDEFVQLRDLFAKHAPKGVDPSEIASLRFPTDRMDPAALDELKGTTKQFIDQYAQGDINKALQTGGYLDLPNGHGRYAIADAIAHTYPASVDTTGKRSYIAPPTKAAKTEEERFLQQRAKEYGYPSIDDVPTDTQNEWLYERNNGKRADKIVAPGGVDAQFNDLVELWKTSHQGQDPPADVRTKLRKQANEVNDNPRGLGGMNALYSEVDPQAIADAIQNGLRSPITSDLGRPANAAVDSVLAKRGVNLQQMQNDWKATQRYYQTLNGTAQIRIRQNIDNVTHSLDTVSDLADRWNGGGLPLLNKANLALAKNGRYGKDWASVANQLEAQIADVTSEMAGVYMGGNSPTDHALSLAAKNLSANWDNKVLQDMIRLARTNLKNRANAIDSTGPVTPGGADNKYYTPKMVPSHETGGAEQWVRDPATGALVRKGSK